MILLVSYRRPDRQDVASRISDRLVAAFGREVVIEDVDTDLVTFMESPFAAWMNRLRLHDPDRAVPDADSEEDALGYMGTILKLPSLGAQIRSACVTNIGCLLRISAPVGRRYQVQRSADLAQWTSLAGYVVGNKPELADYLDPAAIPPRHRAFYRLLLQE